MIVFGLESLENEERNATVSWLMYEVLNVDVTIRAAKRATPRNNMVYLMGDYNARVGRTTDYIYSIDDIPERIVQ